jgi:hypothetical protein
VSPKRRTQPDDDDLRAERASDIHEQIEALKAEDPSPESHGGPGGRAADRLREFERARRATNGDDAAEPEADPGSTKSSKPTRSKSASRAPLPHDPEEG